MLALYPFVVSSIDMSCRTEMIFSTGNAVASLNQAAGTRFTRGQSKKQWLGRTFAETQLWTHFAPRNVRIVGPNAFAPHKVQ